MYGPSLFFSHSAFISNSRAASFTLNCSTSRWCSPRRLASRLTCCAGSSTGCRTSSARIRRCEKCACSVASLSRFSASCNDANNVSQSVRHRRRRRRRRALLALDERAARLARRQQALFYKSEFVNAQVCVLLSLRIRSKNKYQLQLKRHNDSTFVWTID